MRARNIKPGFFKNEALAECSPMARLLFAGLWCMADREGRLEDRPKRIKGELFAYDTEDVEPLLQQLERHGFIARYPVNDSRLIQIVKFGKHQNPHHREPPSTLPSMPSPGLGADGNPPEPEAKDGSHPREAPGEPEASPRLGPPRSDLARGSSRADSGFLIPESPPISPKGTKGPVGLKAWLDHIKANGEKPIPEDDAVFAYATEVGIPTEFLRLAWLEFRHQYQQPNAKRKSDWRAHFRNAVRRNWLKLWYANGDVYQLTTTGVQAQRAHQERAAA